MRRILLPALNTALTGSLLTAVVCTRTMMRELISHRPFALPN